jgi:hypothetical protein
MENYSDSDTSSESEYESGRSSAAGSDCDEDEDEDEPSQNLGLEPELSEFHDEYENALWNPEVQLHAQLHAAQLAQLHAEIKARAKLSVPTYEKLSRPWPTGPFDVRILPDDMKHLIHYFELFWGPEVWSTLIENTNAYAQYKKAWHKNKGEGKTR